MPDPREELDNLTLLVNSEQWVEYVKLLKQRKDFLQGEVNRFVREQKLIEAYGELCKFDDINKTLQLVKSKLETLRKEQ